MDDDCIALKPNVVIMLVGGNDAWEEYSPELCPPPNQTLESNMDELFGRMKNELDDAQILYVLPFLVDTLEEFHPFIKTLNFFMTGLRPVRQLSSSLIRRSGGRSRKPCRRFPGSLWRE